MYIVTVESKIVSATLKEDGTLEVVRQFPSNMTFACYPPRSAPDRVIKEIYRAKEGRIDLVETVEGKHTPAHAVPEQIEFER